VSDRELIALIDELVAGSDELEWLEFKDSFFEPQLLGEYLSALANGACLAGKPTGYLLFGVGNDPRRVVGTSFNPHRVKAKGNQDLLPWLMGGLQPNLGFDVAVVPHPDGQVVVFAAVAARDQPVRFYGTAYVRVGSSKTLLSNHPEKERAIWQRGRDWSALVCENATVADLEPDALVKAREQFSIKHPRQASDVVGWDDVTFLNKAKLAKQGALTNAAVLLLGRAEAATLLSPAVAKISWVLKDTTNQELDYEHFGPPFVLSVDRVLQRVRNLTVRALPSGTLFPMEMTQYDPWVMREALHNCIAHQDYGLRGRINLVETPDSVLLTNMGTFLPGSVEEVIARDAPLEIYRNPFLAEAMVELNMIDTQGGGIKRMFQTQKRRSFPMPDYDLSAPDRVAVRIPGRILDERYTRLLMERTDLNLWQVVLLDRVQKRLPISRDEHRDLKAAGLVEGRYPTLMVAAAVARVTGEKGRHILERGFDKRYYLDLIVELVRQHGPVDRKDVDAALMPKLPDRLSEQQKKDMVHNLLKQLSRNGLIINKGTRGRPQWEIIADDDDRLQDPGQ
jgi:ATP-dependent DNA helicase RecG